MALSNAGKHGSIPVRAFAEEYPYQVIISAHETTPSLTYQDGGLVTTFSRSSDGVYVLTLSHRYERIIIGGCNVRVNDGTDWTVKVVPVEGNSAANTLTVNVALAGTLDDPDVEVDISFTLIGAHFHPNNGVGAVAAS